MATIGQFVEVEEKQDAGASPGSLDGGEGLAQSKGKNDNVTRRWATADKNAQVRNMLEGKRTCSAPLDSHKDELEAKESCTKPLDCAKVPPPIPPRNYFEHKMQVPAKVESKVQVPAKVDAPSRPKRPVSLPRRKYSSTRFIPPPVPKIVVKTESEPSTVSVSKSPVNKLNQRIVDISVPGYSVKVDLQDAAQKPYVVYYIQVRCGNGQGWTLQRRFSELYSFSSSVKARNFLSGSRVVNRPSFPSRFTSKNKFSPKLLESRRQRLESYFQQLLEGSGFSEQGEGSLYEAIEDLVEAKEARERALAQPTRSRGRSFHLENIEDGPASVRDRVSLQAKALMKEVAKNRPHFAKAPSFADKGRNEKTQTVYLSLGRLVAIQQGQVDEFAKTMVELFPESRFLSETVSVDGCIDVETDTDILKGVSRLTVESEAPSRTRTYISSFFQGSKRNLLKADPNPTDIAESFLKRVHRFLAKLSFKVLESHKELIVHSEKSGLSEDFCFDILYRLFEASLIRRHPDVMKSLLAATRAIPELVEKDARLFKIKHALRATYIEGGIPPSLFGACVHPGFDLDNEAKEEVAGHFCWGWEDAVGTLNSLSDHEKFALPSAKADLIMKCVNQIHESLAQRYRKDVRDPQILGADDFIPVLFYVIACSNLKNACSLHKYISTLASDALMDTEVKYWLTVFESGLHFVSCLDIQVV